MPALVDHGRVCSNLQGPLNAGLKEEGSDTSSLSTTTAKAFSPRQSGSTRAIRRVPELVSCRDLGRFIDGVDEDTLEAQAVADAATRRSKTQALHALAKKGESSSPSMSVALPAPPHSLRRATHKASRITYTPSLKFDTSVHGTADKHMPPPIPTGATTPRHMPARTKPRLFELEDAPVFYPTWDEFQDPLKYIEWTARADGGNGAEYGIAKIVPPSGWHMDFCADESTFRFRTRVQRLNELSAEGRVAQNYVEQLEQFHAQQGHGRVHIPQLSHRPIDLYALKRAVAVCGSDSWTDVAQRLGYDVENTPKCVSVLQSAYARLVEPFEAFIEKLRISKANGDDAKSQGPLPTVTNTQERTTACSDCSVCKGHAKPIVTCAECEQSYHLKCVTPPLSQVPRGDWICPTCLVRTGGDFGFDDGETHSLYSFWRRCHAFEQLWASRAGWTDWDSISLSEREDRVEAEFWRLVHSVEELVDVEYGADVHSTTHGHASPTMEGHPRNAYARSGWNLNNLPILHGSLLRYIRSEISGMTAPWIYIGMMFSAFCWHNEDHYTYSINYQHFGATKTWYGVPGAHAEAFESAMERIAPELFAACPDLLLQLVTMMSPELAKREGVRMYACNQHPNEFVVTYPKAYHSGLNHGFNLNEAVNFALPDWVMQGLECVRRYQKHARQPVFSHDELLVSIALHSQQLSTAAWLHPAFDDMVSRELAGRARIRSSIRAAGPDVDEEPFDQDLEVACAHCKTLCYLSHVVSLHSAASKAACLAHAEQVHGRHPATWMLRVRHSDDFLRTHASRLAERAAAPLAWQQRVRRFLVQHPRPPLRTLRMLTQEGEKIPLRLPEHTCLEQFLSRAEPWIEQARVFLSKRQAKQGGRRAKAVEPKRGEYTLPRSGSAAGPGISSTSTDSSCASSESTVAVDRSPAKLLALHERAVSLPFDAPELQQLNAVVDQMHAFCAQASTYLDRDAETRDALSYVDEAERVLAQGELLHVDLPEVAALHRWIAHVRWFSEVQDIGSGFLTRDEVAELEKEANACGISASHPMRLTLEQRMQRGMAWDSAALALLEQSPVVSQAALHDLLNVPADVAMSSDIRARVHALEHKAAQWHSTITTVYEHTHPSAQLRTSDVPDHVPYLSEARQVLADARAARVELPHAASIEAAIVLHDEWNAELAHILQLSGPDAIEAVREFCERTIRTANAEAVNRGACDAPTCAPILSYPPVPYPAPRSVEAPCLCFEARMDRTTSVACAQCCTVYHLRCLDRKTKPSRGWRCAFCDVTQLRTWVTNRRAISQLPLVALLQNAKYQRDQLRFVPLNFVRLQAAVRATVEFGVAVAMQFQAGRLPSILIDTPAKTGQAIDLPAPSPQLRHIARRALACPIDVLLLGDSAPQHHQHVPNVLDVFLPAFHITPRMHSGSTSLKGKRSASSSSMSLSQTKEVAAAAQPRAPARAPPPRKRAKRARFTFREELRLASLPPDMYCFCGAPDNGTMVQCDRCSHWFHSACMCIQDTTALQDKWFCPVCCFRQRIKYAHADVKIRDVTGETDPAAPSQPDYFVDVAASLKSQSTPVLKRQACVAPRRIILHLCEFEPAIPAAELSHSAGDSSAVAAAARPAHFRPSIHDESVASTSASAPVTDSTTSHIPASLSHAPPAKRARLEPLARPPPSQRPAISLPVSEEERHRLGRANLLRRGVSEAMMNAYPMGWDGESIVCQIAPDCHVLLGPHISLAHDDPDGTHLLRMAMEGLVPWASYIRSPSMWHPGPPSTTMPPPRLPSITAMRPGATSQTFPTMAPPMSSGQHIPQHVPHASSMPPLDRSSITQTPIAPPAPPALPAHSVAPHTYMP